MDGTHHSLKVLRNSLPRLIGSNPTSKNETPFEELFQLHNTMRAAEKSSWSSSYLQRRAMKRYEPCCFISETSRADQGSSRSGVVRANDFSAWLSSLRATCTDPELSAQNKLAPSKDQEATACKINVNESVLVRKLSGERNDCETDQHL